MDEQDFVIRILSALAMGMVLGIERQLGQHPAGIRTNSLVCLGAALFVTLSVKLEPNSATRVAGQVVSGIGFICGGAILREGVNVRGMNTAATLWCSAAIGTLNGLGFPSLALLATVAVLGAHLVFRPLAHAIDQYTHGKAETEILCEVKLVCLKASEGMVHALLTEQIKTARLRLQGLTLQDTPTVGQVEMTTQLFALRHDEKAMNDLVARLAALAEVVRASWAKAR